MTDERPIQFVGDISRSHAQRRPDHDAVVSAAGRTTYRELDRRASQVADALIAAGVASQARVAIAGRNSDAFFEILFGAAKANVALVPLNWRLAPPELAHVIEDAGAEVLFVGRELYKTVDQIRPVLTTVRTVVALEGPLESCPRTCAPRLGAVPVVAQSPSRASDPEESTRLIDDEVALAMYAGGRPASKASS